MNVLFLCVANSARSQIAEGWGHQLFPGGWRSMSAGSEPTSVRPQAIEVMREVGIDLTSHRSEHIEVFRDQRVDVVITLCAEEYCPVWLGIAQRIHWPIPDPAGHDDEPHEAQLERFRVARDDIKQRLEAWLVGA
jgi:arsenate reductase (thioredoxin)